MGFGKSMATVTAGRVIDEDALDVPADAGTDLSTGGSDLAGTDTGPAGVLGSNLADAADVAAPAGGTGDGTGTVRTAALATELMDFRGLYRLLGAAAAAMLAARFWVAAQARRRPALQRPDLRTMWRW
jgi:hypothetical protein